MSLMIRLSQQLVHDIDLLISHVDSVKQHDEDFTLTAA